MAEAPAGWVTAVQAAATVTENSPEAIAAAVRRLVDEVLAGAHADDVVAALFSSSPDLDAAFPASVARGYRLERVPLMGLTAPAQARGTVELLLHLRAGAPSAA